MRTRIIVKMEPIILAITGSSDEKIESLTKEVKLEIDSDLGKDSALIVSPAAYVKDPSHLEVLNPFARALYWSHILHQAIDMAKKRRNEFILVQGYYYKYLAQEMARHLSEDRAVQLLTCFPQPYITFFIDSDVELNKVNEALLKIEQNFGPWIHLPKAKTDHERAETATRFISDLLDQFQYEKANAVV